MENSRILIVDDIEENLKVLTETLTHEGYAPLQAKNGERALQIAEKARPDLILLDIQMPGMDGYETIKRLKENENTSDIPVIFISALNQIEDKVKGFQAGAVDYVSKPFQKEEVIARVSTHLKLRRAQQEITREKALSDKLLLNVLPAAVAEELKQSGQSTPQNFPDVSILFTDFLDFTSKAENMEPALLLSELNDMFTAFDTIMEKHQCERIKTIGDAYLAVCGMPRPHADHAERLVRAAAEIREYLKERNRQQSRQWEIRIGVHSGEVVGGIVGTKKYLYDVFGDGVNTASRMESLCPPMEVNISEATAEKLAGAFPLSDVREAEVKGKGTMKMYLLGDINA